MRIKRETMLGMLRRADVGRTADRRLETLEQCKCYIFDGGEIITFNDEICYRGPCPLEFTAAVPGKLLWSLLDRMPDDEVRLQRKGSELLVRGKNRQAGVACAREVLLPYDVVPAPDKWTALSNPGEFVKLLRMAAQTCGKDYAEILTTVVHITPELIEASDNTRLFRARIDTGFPTEVCVPGRTIEKVCGMPLQSVCLQEGWVQFQLDDGAVVSLRCYHEDYHDNIEDVLEVRGEKMLLPSILSEMLGRAEIMQDEELPLVEVVVEDNMLCLTARKEGGWIRERRRVPYNKEALKFHINPQFLRDILTYSRRITVGPSRIKLAKGSIEFVTALAY